MTANEFLVPSHIKQKLKNLGYTIDEQMTERIKLWWNWYTNTDNWYKVSYESPDHHGSRDRLSVHPARKAAREWASLLLTDNTEISCEDAASNEWLQEYLASSKFWPNCQSLIEKAFAIGTGGYSLWFDLGEETTIKVRKSDARMVVPLTWDDDGCTECAFVSRVYFKGKPADQLQIHVIGERGYDIRTYVWIDGKPQDPENGGFIEEFETLCPTPTFALVRPGIENTYVDNSAYGVSVFADAIDAIKAVDLSFDAVFQEIELTEPKVFLDEKMIDYRKKDAKGNAIPKAPKSRIFRKLLGESGKNLYEVYSPDIRIDPLEKALNIALAEFGDQTGFGQEYFTLDKAGGLKTATEVVSDNSELMRNVRKHENSIAGSLKTIITALLTCAREHCGAPIAEKFGKISIQFDDSVIIDTQTEKNTMLSEITAGVLPKWKYAERFYGMSEEEAKAWVSEDEVVDIGF